MAASAEAHSRRIRQLRDEVHRLVDEVIDSGVYHGGRHPKALEQTVDSIWGGHSVAVTLPIDFADRNHTYDKYPIVLDNADRALALLRHLDRHDVVAEQVYPVLVHEQPAFDAANTRPHRVHAVPHATHFALDSGPARRTQSALPRVGKSCPPIILVD
ncbi:hypothetical protein AB0M22_45355 [Nocardia sp. NPDC051756]|uniref:hypothetical protein n=1 Tax=Nocardia sp. NPDC051756 TaxID=3154751 RepID=UPI003431F9D3